MRNLAPALTLLLVLAGCASGPARQTGPSMAELASMLSAKSGKDMPVSRIAKLKCSEISEEPGEFPCSWKQERPTGSWHLRSAVVAREGDQWIFIDGPDEQF